MTNELIIALDTPSLEKAESLIHQTREYCKTYKVGLELFTAHGPKSIEVVKKNNAEVFLDLKLHDIPNTVASALRQIASYGVQMTTVHALSGPSVLSSAANALEKINSKMKILAVSILTHHSEAELLQLGFPKKAESMVQDLLAQAKNSGLIGCVCSPQEAQSVRSSLGQKMVIVCPGVRPIGASLGDQNRVATPFQTIQNGANFLVVGRPITQAKCPLSAAKQIAHEIEEGKREKQKTQSEVCS